MGFKIFLKASQDRRISVQQEALCRLLSKLSVLEQLRDEADETRRQMDRQTEESRRTERDTEELETQLLTLDTSDPQHVSFTGSLHCANQDIYICLLFIICLLIVCC